MNLHNFLKRGALLIAFTAIVWAQAMTSIQGTVKGKDGKPIKDVEIKITRTDIKGNYKIKTDKNGKYNYATLPQGTYDVEMTASGQTIFQTKGVKTNYAGPIPIDVDMSKQEEAQAAAAAAPAGPAAPAAPPAPKEMTEAEKKAQAEAQAKFEKEMKEYQEAQSKNAGLQTAFNTAMEAAKAKNWPVAIENFTKASEIDPTQHAVFGQLADAYQKKAESERGADRLADFNKSAEAYLKAIAIKADDPTYRYNASVVLARSNKLEDAQTQLTEAAKLDPTGASKGYFNLGQVYFDTNRGEPAEAAYKKAIELDAKYAAAYMGLGRVLIQRATEKDGKLVAPAGTAEAFQKYLEISPEGAESADAKAMLEVLGATITNSINRGPAPAPAKGKAKGK
jgi:tetratricopeptide (TPR) repeat protein